MSTPEWVERDGETLAQWLREAATEIEKAHRSLDDHGAPREFEHGIELTLAARIETLMLGGSEEGGEK